MLVYCKHETSGETAAIRAGFTVDFPAIHDEAKPKNNRCNQK